ncbi:lipoprotein signal peptidase [bacterium BMS3Abin03]|nr:lipoprotein signal peptidase [bacterium BMS3Abin03]
MRVLYLTLSVLIIDQVSKFYIKGIKIPFLNFNHIGMYPGESIPVIGNFFKITFIENPGMAFGFNPGSDYKLLISLFSVAASIALLIYLYAERNKQLSLRISLALILGGAIGNVIDRTFYGIIYKYAPLFYGKVVDFLDFDFFNFTILGRSYDRWPVFNLADVSVTIGVLILILFYRHHEEDTETSAVSEDDNNSSQPAVEGTEENKRDMNNSTGNTDDVENDKGEEISL